MPHALTDLIQGFSIIVLGITAILEARSHKKLRERHTTALHILNSISETHQDIINAYGRSIASLKDRIEAIEQKNN